MTQRLPHLTSRLQGFGTTIFSEMTALALRHGAVNLGQGAPDFPAPQQVKDAAVKAIGEDRNQYAPGDGVPALRQAIAGHQQRFWQLDYDPDTEVTVTAGATEAICAALIALCDVGDEVVMFEPYYDSYRASIAMAGASERVVTLRPPDFSVDPVELAAVITPKTRAIIVNTPHNPTGKVFSPAELATIADVCRRHDVIAITDEVYEHLVFDGEHVPLASLPGMRERTVLISSAGKTFSVTGWKVGWISGPAELVAATKAVKQFLTYVSGAPFQPAIADALALPDAFFADLAAGLQRRRDLLVDGLRAAGFTVYSPAGTYFVLTDVAPLGFTDGVELCWRLPELVGVAAVPVSVFCVDPELGRTLVRFAFCKREEVLAEAVERLAHLPS